MKIKKKGKRGGKAKVLKKEQQEQLFSSGFLCSRDRALMGTCFYAAARICEARRMFLEDICDSKRLLEKKELILRDQLVLRKNTTKGSIETREIPIHPKLAKIYRQYIEDSWTLLEIRKQIPAWSTTSLNFLQRTFRDDGKIVCPNCYSQDLGNRGMFGRSEVKAYFCKSCEFSFRETGIFDEFPHLKEKIISLGVFNSLTYGFLFLDSSNNYLFPGREGKSCLSYSAAQVIIRAARERSGLEEVSTHSGRRTALTLLNRNKTPLKVIQKISGHRSLDVLKEYLDVDPEEVEKAIKLLPYMFPY